MNGFLFDNDGTLVDTHAIILDSMRYSTRKVLGRVYPDEVLMHRVGQPLFDQMCFFTSDEDTRNEIVRVYREHNATIHDKRIKAFPGMADALAALRDQGYALGVSTSKLRSIAWRGLEITGLAPYLDCCIGSEDCVEHKPKPEPVLRGIEALQLTTETCAYVGDSPYDIQAGNAAGCVTVAVTWGSFAKEVLLEQHPDHVCESLDELVSLGATLKQEHQGA